MPSYRDKEFPIISSDPVNPALAKASASFFLSLVISAKNYLIKSNLNT